MKTTIFTLAAAATLVSAQNFGAEPACAIPCLTSAISAAGCALADEACQCGTGMAAIQSDVTPCLLTACSQSDLLIAASVGLALCSSFSANLASVSASTTVSSGTASTSVVSTTPTSTVSAQTTSVALSTSAPATTSAPVSTKASNSTVATSSSPAVVSVAGAPMMVAGMGGLVGIVAGFLAAL